MDKIKSSITKILATWVGIGVALVAIGSVGVVDIPDAWLQLFSAGTAQKLQETVDILFQAWGAVIATAQAIRAIFLSKQGEVSTLGEAHIKNWKYSPFKV